MASLSMPLMTRKNNNLLPCKQVWMRKPILETVGLHVLKRPRAMIVHEACTGPLTKISDIYLFCAIIEKGEQ